MNTKKIWLISLLFGLAVAGFSYMNFFSKESVSTAAVGTSSQEAEEKKDGNTEKQTEEEQKIARDITNPMVEVSKGKRAISLKVNLQQGVSGYVVPNSMVDVIAYETSKDDDTGKKFKSAVLVLENVKVLASGKAADNKEEALLYETVSLEVTAEQGVMLSLAALDKDGFYLMLRNTEDPETGKTGLKQIREVIEEEGEE